MAFWEQMSKKISDAGQGAAQQAKNFSEVTKLNGTISEKEKKITQLFHAMGEAYYAQHKDDPAADQPEKIEEVKALAAEIDRCRNEINRIKGIVKCPNCGAEVTSGSAFCNSCGSKMPQEQKEEPVPEGMRRCPGCNAVVSKENAFCNQCGMKLEPVQSEEPVQTEPVVEPVQSPEAVWPVEEPAQNAEAYRPAEEPSQNPE